MNNFTPELYELVDGKGNKCTFELLDTAILDGEQYYVMTPAMDSEEYLNYDGDVIIMKSEFADGEEVLASVTDEDEYDNISEFFMKRMEYIFEGDGEEHENYC